MIYMIMNINELTEGLTRKYFPMLTEAKQNKLLSYKNGQDSAVLFCCEILARKCLSQLCDAPEYSFDILCNPNSRSAVGNYSAELSIVNTGDFIGCAASYDYIGIGISPITAFSFTEAQEILTDSEIRAVFSDSGYSYNQLINSGKIENKSCCEKFAVFSALKEAYFNASGRGLRSVKRKVSFSIGDNQVLCSEGNFDVSKVFVDAKNRIAVAVIERKKYE